MPTPRPDRKPLSPLFSSGPCRKRPGWSLDRLKTEAIGRSHRSDLGKEKLFQAIEKTKKILEIPEDYRLAIMPGSDTGVIELALWHFLGTRPVTVLAWDVFGKEWLNDVVNHLKLDHVVTQSMPAGELPDLRAVDFSHDVVFTWNGTTSGVNLPNSDWIARDRKGLTICDAVSAVFTVKLPWSELDVTTFSWQKGVGGEAAHGMIALSPRAVERLQTFKAVNPLPKIFRLVDEDGALKEPVFRGETVNTPSLLCVEDYLDALSWAESIGGLDALTLRCQTSLDIITSWVATQGDWIRFLASNPSVRSPATSCLILADPRLSNLPHAAQWEIIRAMAKRLADEKVALDISGHAASYPCLRIWTGPTVDPTDVALLLPWLEWAYKEVMKTYS